MNYKSLADLNRDILAWMESIPKDIDVVIGIPRSGMLAADLIALYLNKPLADIDGFIKGHIMGVGTHKISMEKTAHGQALVVDDSVLTGSAVRRAKEKLEAARPDYRFIFASPYVAQDSAHMVDQYYQVLPIPRVFEWNMFHHSILSKSCVDIDGILCRDPKPEENDDGPAYRNFISTVAVKIRPSIAIKWLVTSRLEKYRAQTREWLAANGIMYENLFMLDLPDQAARVRLGSHAAFKARVYAETQAVIFIESSYEQALQIARICGKPVICTDSGSMVFPNEYKALAKDAQNIYQILKGRVKRLLSLLKRRISAAERRD